MVTRPWMPTGAISSTPTRRRPVAQAVLAALLACAGAGCGEDSRTDRTTSSAAGTPTPAGRTVPGPERTTTATTDRLPAPPAGGEAGASRSCGTVGDSPRYRLRATGTTCADARALQRGWFAASSAGRRPNGYNCEVGGLAATDVPESVFCRRGSRTVRWSVERADGYSGPDRQAPATPGSAPSAGQSSIEDLARTCGDSSAFDRVSSVGSGGCQAAKEVADAFETQYYQAGATRVTTLLTRMMDYRCVRSQRQLNASTSYLRFDCTATRPKDAASSGVPLRVRFHEFGDA